MRNLASIQRVLSVEPIPGADLIEKLQILGWECVGKKGEYKPGDLCVYLEIDSIVPERPEFEFMRDRGWRVKTARFKGQVAQGLPMPLSILPIGNYKEDQDVTEILGVKKYEPYEVNVGGKQQPRGRRPFPSFLHKTDETRVQVLEGVLEKYKGWEFVSCEKMDGSSMTVFVNNGKFGVCSRNGQLRKPDATWWDRFLIKSQLSKRIKTVGYYTYKAVGFNTLLTQWFKEYIFQPLIEATNPDVGDDNHFWAVAKSLHLEEKMSLTYPGWNYAVQGELCGPGIQGNKYNLQTHRLFLFNVYDINQARYLGWDDAVKVAEQLGVETVPFLGKFILNHTVSELVEMAKGNSKHNAKTKREGIVIRPTREITDTAFSKLHASRVSCKIINLDFNLKYDQ